MSDDNLINVEDDVLAPPEPAPVETPPEPVAAAPEADGEVDLNAVDVKDEARIKGLIGELSRKRAENKELRAAKERLGQVEAELSQIRPQLEFVRSNPQLFQPRQAEPEKPAPPEADPDALEAARLMDFYKADGSPDVERGARYLALQDRRAGRVAQQAMAPTVDQALQDRAQANYAMLRNFKLPSGEPLKQEIVDQVWSATAREQNGLRTLADPNSVRALALLAIGTQSLMAKPTTVPTPAPPLVTEAAGGRATTPQQRLSALEENTLRQRGMTTAKYQELMKDFKPGQSNVLESD